MDGGKRRERNDIVGEGEKGGIVKIKQNVRVNEEKRKRET